MNTFQIKRTASLAQRMNEIINYLIHESESFSTFPFHQRRPTEMQYICSPQITETVNVFAFMASICATAHFGMMDYGAPGVGMKRIDSVIQKMK